MTEVGEVYIDKQTITIYKDIEAFCAVSGYLLRERLRFCANPADAVAELLERMGKKEKK